MRRGKRRGKEEEKTERDERGDEREKSSTHREVFAVKVEKTSRVCGDWVRARVQIYGLVVRREYCNLEKVPRVEIRVLAHVLRTVARGQG